MGKIGTRETQPPTKSVLVGTRFLSLMVQLKLRPVGGLWQGLGEGVAGQRCSAPQESAGTGEQAEPLISRVVFGGSVGQFHLHFLVDEGVIGGWWVSEFYVCVYVSTERRARLFLFYRTWFPPPLTPRHQSLVFSSKIILMNVFFFWVLQGPCLLHHLPNSISHLSATLQPH